MYKINYINLFFNDLSTSIIIYSIAYKYIIYESKNHYLQIFLTLH